MTDSKPKRRIRNAVIVILFVGAALLLTSTLIGSLADTRDWRQWWPSGSVTDIKVMIQSFGPWGVGAAIGLMVIHSFVPFPAEFVAIANGMIYGPIWGTVITWVGAMMGAYLAFGLARRFGRSSIQKILTKKNLDKLDTWVAKSGGGALFFSRFIPVISFNLINYAAGLTGISWWTFTWATGLGILPLCTLMVIMGDQVGKLPWQAWFFLFAIAIAIWLIVQKAVITKSRTDARDI